MSNWVVSFVPDVGGNMPQEAQYATEAEARLLYDQAHAAADGERVLVKEIRGYEYSIVPFRYIILLNSPQIRAGQEAAARTAHAQHSEGGIITGGPRSSH